MAFHNTEERYDYIFGNNAKRLEPQKSSAQRDERSAGTKKKGSAQKAKLTSIEKMRARHLAIDWRYTVVALVAVLFCAVAAMGYLRGTAELRVMEREISSLKTEKSALLSKQAALESEIDKSINLEEIRKYAEKNLNMVIPDDSNTIWYESDSDDYFRQYESVDTGN